VVLGAGRALFRLEDLSRLAALVQALDLNGSVEDKGSATC
jgi:hypothetical protein